MFPYNTYQDQVDPSFTMGDPNRPQQPLLESPMQPQPQQGMRPIQAGMPNQSPFAQAMNSPGMAMAGQAMNNMSALRRGRTPAQTPVQAYQSAVANQSNQRMREDAFSQKMNPFFEYETAKERGIIPPDMSYADFTRIGLRGIDSTSPIKNMQVWDSLPANQQKEGETDDEYEERRAGAFDNMVRAGIQYKTGGGGVGYTNAIGGRGGPLVGSEGATGRNAREAGAITGAQEETKTNAGQVREGLTGASTARVAYQTAENMMDVTDQWLERFDSNDPPDTGMVPALMAKVFGIGPEELGDLNAETINTALLNLGIANLAPVTEQEFASVMQIWADIAKSPEMNKGALKNAKRRTERLMGLIRDDAIYNAGLVEEYGTEGQRGAFTRSNPFIKRLMEEPEGEPQVDF